LAVVLVLKKKKSPSGMCSAQYATGMSPVSSCIPEALAVQAGNTTEPVVGKFFKKEIGGESFQLIEKPLVIRFDKNCTREN
jgi:hypothetical protein